MTPASRPMDAKTTHHETKLHILDARDRYGAWGILSIKDELERKCQCIRTRVINLAPNMVDDLIRVLLGSGYLVSQESSGPNQVELIVEKCPNHGDSDDS